MAYATSIANISEYEALLSIISSLSSPGKDELVMLFSCGMHVPNATLGPFLSTTVWNAGITSLCELADAVYVFDQFLESLSSSTWYSDVPATYNSYLCSINRLLRTYRCRLRYYEAKVRQQRTFVSIDSLINFLSPWTSLIPALETIHKQAILNNHHCQENWKCALHLLATLLQSLKVSKNGLRICLLKIFLETLKPYFTILDNWLCNSCVIDQKDEFLISRSNTLQNGNIVIKDYPSFLSGLVEKNDFFDNLVYYANKACSSIDFLALLQKDLPSSDTSESLYKSFINRILVEVKLFPKSNAFSSQVNLDTNLPSTNQPLPDESEIEVYTGLNGTDSKLFMDMQMCFSHFFNKSSKNMTEDPLDILFSLDLNTAPLDIILQRCCTDTISAVLQPSGFARDILLTDYELGGHLAALRAVFLFSDGSCMPQVCKAIAKGGLLPSEIASLLPEGPSRFTVTVRPGKFVSGSAAVNHLHIGYIRNPPINLVITDAAIERYNELFRLLLRVKWAMHQLNGTNMKSMWHRQDSKIASRLYSIRAFLLHTVSSLHQYIIAAVSTGDSKVLAACSVARNIHIIALELEKFLDSLRRRCFLLGGTAVADCIFSLLRAADELRSLWDLPKWDHDVILRLSNLETSYQETTINLAELISDLSTSQVFKEFSHFKHLSDELLHNMPGNWDSRQY